VQVRAWVQTQGYLIPQIAVFPLLPAPSLLPSSSELGQGLTPSCLCGIWSCLSYSGPQGLKGSMFKAWRIHNWKVLHLQKTQCLWLSPVVPALLLTAGLGLDALLWPTAGRKDQRLGWSGWDWAFTSMLWALGLGSSLCSVHHTASPSHHSAPNRMLCYEIREGEPQTGVKM
jgi:hypothetical protein